MQRRNHWLDQIKGLACLLIVCHHLAFYGPMTDVLKPLIPATLDWFNDYARMAVQIFLVLAGYLAAAGLAPDGVAKRHDFLSSIGKRFIRLVVPFVAALSVTILINEVVRAMGFSHESVSPPPDWDQLLAHLFLLHGIGGWDSLSAGVWYVAIDFQLYCLAVMWIALSSRFIVRQKPYAEHTETGNRWMNLLQLGVFIMTGMSLLLWNRNSSLDNWAVYFFGAYGLGMMAWWGGHASTQRARWLWIFMMALIGCVALVIEWRERIALALLTSLLLALGSVFSIPRFLREWRWKPLEFLGQISYSIFLIHFSICLLINAVVSLWWPESITANAIGVAVAVVCSVAAGYGLFRWVESRSAGWLNLLHWQAGAMGVGAAAALNLI